MGERHGPGDLHTACELPLAKPARQTKETVDGDDGETVIVPADPAPSTRDSSSLFGRGVLLMAAGLGLLIGLVVAAAVVTAGDSESVRIAPPVEAGDECIIVGVGAIEGSSCDAPGALSVASRSQSSTVCATGTTRLEAPDGETFCLHPAAQD